MQTNNPNSKRRFDGQPPQYRYSVPPQGQPAPQRNAVPTGNIRSQNGPGRQPQPQSQIQQQGPTQNAVAQAVQQQQQQHSVAMQQQPISFGYPTGGMMVQQQVYPTAPNQGNIFRVAAAPAYAQQQYYYPQAISGSYVQTTLQHQYQGHPHHTGLQFSPAYQVTSATPQYIQTQPRMPSQMQQAHVGQQHVQQQHQVHHQSGHHVAATTAAVHHQGPQHNAHQHQPSAVAAPIPQVQTGRPDGVTVPVQPQPERKRKLLNIIDPTTGQNVLDADAPVPTDTSSSAPNASDSGKQVHTAPSDSASANQTTGSASSNVALDKAIDTSAQFSGNHHPGFQNAGTKAVEEVSIITSNKVEESSPEDTASEPVDQTKTNVKERKAIRAEFFQKITQASDEGRVSSSSSNQNANQVQQQTVQSSPETSNTQSDTSKLNSTATTDEVSAEESKDTSLASISPTPIENYVTPTSARVTTPTPVVPLILPQEELDESIADVDEEPITVEAEVVALPLEECSPPMETESPAPVSEEAVSPVIPAAEIEDDSMVVVEDSKEDSVSPEKTSETEQDLVIEGDDRPPASEEQQNGSLKLEEGEINPDSCESGTEDAEESETEIKSKKSGLIKYDRDFLLQLEKQPLSRQKVAIEIPDVAKDNNNKGGHHNQQMKSPGMRGDLYNNSRGSRGPSKPGPNMGNHFGNIRMAGPGMFGSMGGPMMVPPAPPNRGHPNPVKVISFQSEKPDLHKAENAWKPSVRKQRSSAAAAPVDEDKTEEERITDDIVKKTRGILNKITPENFDKLLGKFMDLPLNDMEERIQEVIKVVFEKAIDEPSFSATYAKMVFTVCKTSPETSKKFRKQILDQCQREFQKNTSDEDELKKMEEGLAAAKDSEKEQLKLELEDKKYSLRRRSLGNVRFIGELYKLQMLTPKIMIECVNMLLSTPDEENLECLCKLLSTVGQKLDESLREQDLKIQHCRANKMELPKFQPDANYMDKTFGKLRNLSDQKNLSSRIRFALLDVVELRENGWRPRRDTNAPKTIEEVRRDAIRQEMEEKRQINSLPPSNSSSGPGMDQRGPAGRQQSSMGSQQQKKNDWNTVQSNKSSRFQVKKSDTPGMPVLAPSGGTWGRGQGQVSTNTSIHSSNLPTPPKSLIPPRFNRFQSLPMDEPRSNSNASNNQPLSNFRDPVPQQLMHSQFPPPLRRPSPATSTASSRENSRPVSPKETSPAMNTDKCTADVRETVKNIFEEYLSVRKFDDTMHWINSRFEGERISEFVDELSRQVCDMSKEEQQKAAGNLVRTLIKQKHVSKEIVFQILVAGVILELPDIVIDVPKATTYVGQFLVEVFGEEESLDWLVAVVEPLISDEYVASIGDELSSNTLNLLKLRKSEEAIQVLFKRTAKKDALQQSVPWLAGETVDSLSQKIIPVLRDRLNSNTDQLSQLFQEKSWDLREELTAESFVEAICTLAWTDINEWDTVTLNKLLPLLPLPNKQLFPKVWGQAKKYFSRNSVDKNHEDELWTLMSKLCLNEPNN